VSAGRSGKKGLASATPKVQAMAKKHSNTEHHIANHENKTEPRKPNQHTKEQKKQHTKKKEVQAQGCKGYGAKMAGVTIIIYTLTPSARLHQSINQTSQTPNTKHHGKPQHTQQTTQKKQKCKQTRLFVYISKPTQMTALRDNNNKQTNSKPKHQTIRINSTPSRAV
jgi:hypothetical protein